MVSLLDGGLAALFGAAFADLYSPGVLHRRVPHAYDAGGSAIGGGWSDLPCRAQLDTTTQAMRQAEGAVDTDQRILVLSTSVTGPISTDDQITVGGQRWGIASIARDPAATYWDLRGTRA